MKFTELPIAGAFLIELEKRVDERGFFARTVCAREFAQHGLNAEFVQQSVSFNSHRGTLRGLHYQSAPDAEIKLVRVTTGAIFDVIVDLRPGSSSYALWYGVDLSAENRCALYISKGIAHGFQTLTENAEVFYQMTVPYSHGSANGIRWDDPVVRVAWPDAENAIVSANDRRLPRLGVA